MREAGVWVIFAGLCGAAAVGLGAFAAHGLSGPEYERARALLETGAKYQLAHAAALIALAVGISNLPGKAARWAGRFFIFGNVVFPGALYAIALTGIGMFGAVAPFGGTAYILGWLCIAWVGGQRMKNGGGPV